MSGYDKSPDYGGDGVSDRRLALIIVGVVVAAGALWFLFQTFMPAPQG